MCKLSYEWALKGVNLWEFQLLMAITVNLDYGPYTDETRRGQLAASLKWLFHERTPDEVPLYLQEATSMLQAIRRYKLVEQAKRPQSSSCGAFSSNGRVTAIQAAVCRYVGTAQGKQPWPRLRSGGPSYASSALSWL